MKHQLYMWGPYRAHLLERHDSYVEAMKVRIFPQFADITGEADRYLEDTWQAFMNMPARDDIDPSDLAESAQEAAVAKYDVLCFLKREIYLGALAGLYHIWERLLRNFLERELNHTVTREASINRAWHSNIDGVVGLLAAFGWNIRTEGFYPYLDACRLIVNVYKHGKGNSFDQLIKKYPHYLRDPNPQIPVLALGGDIHHLDMLEVDEQDILTIAAAMRVFWEKFPERLFLPAQVP